ncbi:hypothetical protein PV08_09681 [Exophiala spinifera]|uniref:Uncharacterized protein n=1 Tax=Exophiala spinifera TaxID=91928 RepID=A0A0D2BMM1_9EURO|nr:uncharacterized protein PV08_09681 [Exophiala spinifera]KIW12404.1 hypothetical protein PV08_09681 [Exophiala spinifera]
MQSIGGNTGSQSSSPSTASAQPGSPFNPDSITRSSAPSVTTTSSTSSGTVASVQDATGQIASQSTTPSSPNVSSSNGSSSNIGGIVGGTIGGLLFGLVVGMLFMFCWARRRAAKASLSSRRAGKISPEKNGTDRSTLQAYESPSDPARWLVYLPQPSDDTELKHQVKTMYNQIDLHVENFYTDRDGGLLTEAVQSILARYETDLLPAPVATIMASTSSKKAVIKHCLTCTIVSRIDAVRPIPQSFLPSEIAALPALLAKNADVEHVSRKKGMHSLNLANHIVSLSSESWLTENDPVFDEAYSTWRVLTAYIRPSAASLTPTQEASVTSEAANFTEAFGPWSKSRGNAAQKANLEEIMRNAIGVGTLLFSQPSVCEFRWIQTSKRHANSATFYITPALLRTSDASGHALSSPHTLLKAAKNND